MMSFRGLPVLAPQGVVAGRIRVRPQVMSDSALLQELSRNPDVVRWTTYPADLDVAGARARIARADAIADQAVFCVVELDDEPAGTCGASAGEADGSVEIFYAVVPWARRQGVASTAVSLLVAAARAAGAESIGLETHLDNVGSHRVAERAGFVKVERSRRVVNDTDTEVLVWRLATQYG